VRRKLLILMVSCTMVLALAAPLFAAGCDEAEPEKEVIVFGAARPLTGPFAVYEEMAFGPIYKMWVDEVNARGGLYIEEYGKRLPIELKIYDDGSDMGTMTSMLERLILEDEVDFILPPASTAFLFAAAPIANKHGYILMGAEGGGTTLTPLLPSLPYYFGVLNYSDHYQMPVLADILSDAGIETAAIMYLEDLHGVEYSGVAGIELTNAGIDIVMTKSVPLGVMDVSSIINQAKTLGAEAFLSFCYPDENFLAIGTAIALDYNPDVFLTGPGANFAFFAGVFGPAAEGIMGYGAWNTKSSAASEDWHLVLTLLMIGTSGVLCGAVAQAHGRAVVGWTIFGALLPYIAAFVLLAVIQAEMKARAKAIALASAALHGYGADAERSRLEPPALADEQRLATCPECGKPDQPARSQTEVDDLLFKHQLLPGIIQLSLVFVLLG